MHNAIAGHANSIGNSNMAMVNKFMNNFRPGFRTLNNKNGAYRQTARKLFYLETFLFQIGTKEY